MASDSTLRVSYDGHLQIIEFDNPKKKNAMSLDTYAALSKALTSAAKNDNVKISVITGRGNYFSSGNLNSLDALTVSGQPVTADEAFKKANSLYRIAIDDLIDYPKVLVAVVNGPAIGIACTMLALCDIVYAADSAWFLTPFTSWGITPEGCSSYLFPRIMGPAKANKMLYFSEKMTASEALKCNFVTEVYKPSDIDILWSKIQSYSALPIGSMLATKRLLRQELREKLHKINVNEAEVLLHRYHFEPEEFIEAITKFVTKTKSKL